MRLQAIAINIMQTVIFRREDYLIMFRDPRMRGSAIRVNFRDLYHDGIFLF